MNRVQSKNDWYIVIFLVIQLELGDERNPLSNVKPYFVLDSFS